MQVIVSIERDPHINIQGKEESKLRNFEYYILILMMIMTPRASLPLCYGGGWLPLVAARYRNFPKPSGISCANRN
jgi:hypothetical protein